MTVKELYDRLSISFPTELSCEWDRDGLMVCPSLDAPVTRVLCTLDVTPAAIARAREVGAEAILSHHPVLFHMPEAITQGDPLADKVFSLLQAGISCLCFHTRADAAAGGVSDLLAAAMKLADVYTPEQGDGILRVGTLPRHVTARELAECVKKTLGSPAVTYADGGKPIRYLALCGGEGKDMIDAALSSGADALLCGRAGYHAMQDAAEAGLTVLEAGHYHTEVAIVGRFAELARQAGVEAICYTECPIGVL